MSQALAADNISYEIDGKKVSNEQFENLKSTLLIDKGSMVEGSGLNINTQIFKASNNAGENFEYVIDSVGMAITYKIRHPYIAK